MKTPHKTSVTLPDMPADLQLERYLVDDLSFKCNKTLVSNNDKSVPTTLSIDFDLKKNTGDEKYYLLEMVIDLNKGQELTQFDTYQIHLHLYGWFRFTADFDEATKSKMMSINASSMLYGIARTTVASLTASFGTTRYMLPTLNLLSVIKAKMESKKDKSKVSFAVTV